MKLLFINPFKACLMFMVFAIVQSASAQHPPCTNSTAPVSAHASISIICSGTTVRLIQIGGNLGDSAVWNWYTGSCGGTLIGTSDSANAALYVTPDSTTTYYVLATGPCNTTTCAAVTVTVNPTPVASFTTNVSSGCAPLTVDFTNTSTNDSTYNWDLGDNHTTNYINPIHTYTNPGTYTVLLTVYSNQGCWDSVSHTITVYSSPTPVITANGPVHFCPPGSVVLDAGVYSSYHWSNGSTNETITVNATGNFVVTVTNGNGCTGTASQAVIVSTNPVVTASGATTFCQGGSVTLTSSTGASYLWSNSSTTQSIIVTASGNYSVTVSDSLGCVLSSSITQVTVNPNPVASFTTNVTSGCTPLTIDFTNYSTGGTSYLWDFGDTTSTNFITPIHVYNHAGTYTVKLTVFNSFNCFDTTSHIITVLQSPSPIISPNGPVHFCPGGSVILNAGVYSSYNWSNGSTTETISVTTSGNYIVTVSNANGCTGTASQSVIVSTNPIVTANGPITFCQGGSVTLTSSIGVSYLWSNSSTTQSIIVTSSGNYSVTVTDSLGCVLNSANTLVTVNPNPVASFTTNVTSGCSPLVVDFTNTSTGGTTYLWDFGDTTSTNFPNPIHTYNYSGTYTVKLTVLSGQGCYDIASSTITILHSPSPIITANGPVHFCPGGSVILNAGVYSSYNWSNGSTTETITTDTAGNYFVTVTSANGCTGTASQRVIVSSNPVITHHTPITFCAGGNVVLYSSQGVSYLWSNAATTDSIIVTTAGNYSVTVTDSLACVLSSTVTVVTVNPSPTASFTTNVTSGCSPLTIYFNNTSTNATSYLWNFGDYLSTNYINPIHTYDTSRTYNVQLTVLDSAGCFDTASANITVLPSPSPVITSNGPTNFCTNVSVNLDAGIYNSYLWNNGSTIETIHVTMTGNYFVTVTGSNGCTGIASQWVIGDTCGALQCTSTYPFQCGKVNSYYPDTNYSGFDNFMARAWTIAGNLSVDRSMMQFNFSNIPNNAILDSANLNLYWHTSADGGHSTTTGSNACWLQRITQPWNPNSVTWNSQPNITDTNQVILPESTFSTENYPDINILSMVNDMRNINNFGLKISLQTEQFYRALIFASIYNSDSTVYPTLNICFHIPVAITTGTVTLIHCSGATFNVPYTVSSNFNAGNIFTAQLSDSTGNFSNPVNIGSLASVTSGIISVTIPHLMPYGNHYRIRVVADNLASIGSNNGADITIYDPIPNILATPSSSLCQGSSATLYAGAYSSYHWSTSSANATITVSTTGNYRVTVTDSHGCTASGADSVTVYPIPNVLINPSDTNVCENSSAYALYGGTPIGGIYSGTGVSNGMFNPSITGLGTFSIMYTYTDSSGCADSASQLVTVNVCSGIPDLSDNNSIIISPNPNDGEFSFENLRFSIYDLRITDVTGRLVFSQLITHNSKLITQLSDGIYFWEVITGTQSENIAKGKFVIIK